MLSATFTYSEGCLLRTAFSYFSTMKRNSILVLALLLSFASHAQTTSDSTQPIVDTSHLRISLITCGVGEEVWELFGHAALRVMDSVKGTDNVYNYGTFDGFAEGFELKFMQGKLLYYVSYYPYYMFLTSSGGTLPRRISTTNMTSSMITAPPG